MKKEFSIKVLNDVFFLYRLITELSMAGYPMRDDWNSRMITEELFDVDTEYFAPCVLIVSYDPISIHNHWGVQFSGPTHIITDEKSYLKTIKDILQ